MSCPVLKAGAYVKDSLQRGKDLYSKETKLPEAAYLQLYTIVLSFRRIRKTGMPEGRLENWGTGTNHTSRGIGGICLHKDAAPCTRSRFARGAQRTAWVLFPGEKGYRPVPADSSVVKTATAKPVILRSKIAQACARAYVRVSTQ
jgi:hypothetical protein